MPPGVSSPVFLLSSEQASALLLFFKNVLFIFERVQVEEGQREGYRGSEVGSVLTAMSPMLGLELTNREIMTGAEVSAQPTEPPR